jgi:hypothetical protein
MSEFREFSSLIRNVADDVFRGLFKPYEDGYVILRRLDCVLETWSPLAKTCWNWRRRVRG